MRLKAVLIIGPTGSGKTPLGELWQLRGLAGRRCHHFDFGERLRRAAETGGCYEPDEHETIRRVLRTGSLLKDAEFPIALKILDGFWAGRAAGEADILILNGLPRHAGQAAAMAGRTDIRAVVRLTADPGVILARIGGNAGGDRAGRGDDDPAAVAARLAVYTSRTKPMENFYALEGVPILVLEVGPLMTAEEMDASVRPRLERLLVCSET